jgi:glycosyltransferase involved in cell wall biosynthesis
VKVDISILIPNLRFGGAEKVVVELANHWSLKGLSVEVLVLEGVGEYCEFLNKRVTLVSLEVNRLAFVIGPLARYLRIKRPSVLWAHLWPLNAIAVVGWMLAGTNTKLFVTNHNMLFYSYVGGSLRRKYLLRLLAPLAYRLATGITAVSKGVASELEHLALLDKGSVRVIYNPVVRPDRLKEINGERLWGSGSHFRIISVGELKRQKNHSVLIDAIAKLKGILPIKCIIIGEGVLRSALQSQINALELADTVSLIGYQSKPFSWYETADLFVLSSDWEGFGNVLIEALSVGLNIVSTNCKSGPSEILEDGRYGLLVEPGNSHALATAILHCRDKKIPSEVLINRANEFCIDTISAQYLDEFGLVMNAQASM